MLKVAVWTHWALLMGPDIAGRRSLLAKLGVAPGVLSAHELIWELAVIAGVQLHAPQAEPARPPRKRKRKAPGAFPHGVGQGSEGQWAFS